MTTRSTTLVESDQLAKAAVNVIRNEDFVPKGKRWPFSRTSKALRDYEKAVQEITTRRRETREHAVEQTLKRERSEADASFERAKNIAASVHSDKITEAQQPYNATEGEARRERDAAVAAATQIYERAVEEAHRTYLQEAGKIDEERDRAVAKAKAQHDEAYAVFEENRRAALAQINRDLRSIPLEGLMRIVEDKQVWQPEDRKKALNGLVEMAGREDIDGEYAELCLRNIAGYVFQDRYLKPDAQHHRLMDASVLEALVDLGRRKPDKRPTIVKYMHEIVVENPGHSSPAFIKSLTELYVAASTDTETVYHAELVENERIFDEMRAYIADALKLTPRRSQVGSPAAVGGTREPTAELADDQETPRMMRRTEADITADVDIRDLVPAESADEPPEPAAKPARTELDALVSADARAATKAPPPKRERASRSRRPEGST